jgi:hypothetical protein
MDKKIVTYSLLAHINNTGKLSKNFDNIFIPLIKRSLANMCKSGQYNGDNINDIKKYVDELYGLDIPLPVLRRFHKLIELEINKSGFEHIKFYNDDSFVIKDYTFNEIDDEVEKKENDLNVLERVYSEFLSSTRYSEKLTTNSIFEFVEQNKHSLGKYINKKYQVHHNEQTIEADFVNFIKSIPYLYNTFQLVYLGSIISTYLEYEPKDIKTDVELVLDTNFIISLLDLKTPESTTNCRRLLEISSKLGYKFTVLGITLREIDQLLRIKIDNYDNTFLSMLVDKEDIYNACQRRKLTKTDLERIKSNVDKEIGAFNISIIPNTEKYENRAKNSEEFERLKEIRNTEFAALHDATCSEYVNVKRGDKPIYSFEKVNCWFVNNSSSKGKNLNRNGIQPAMIKAEDLLNMLWLTSPTVKASLPSEELANIGLSRMVSTALNESLPNSSIIRELDENIRKYAKENISHHDVIRISKSIAQRSYINLDHLNSLADKDSKQFVNQLLQIAGEQKQKDDDYTGLINKLIADIKTKSQKLDEEKKDIVTDKANLAEAIKRNAELNSEIEKVKKEKRISENAYRKIKRDKWIYKKVLRWRTLPFLLVMLGPIFVVGFFIYVKSKETQLITSEVIITSLKNNPSTYIIFSLIVLLYVGLCLKIFSDRFNHSAVMAYKNSLLIPEEYSELN